MSPESKAKGEEPGFDAKLDKLEAIVAQLEEGGLGLEPAIERYQEGIELLKQCHATLEGYKKRVEELTEGAEEVLKPFEADPDFADE